MLAATLLIRASFLVFGQRLAFPDWLNRALHYVPAAVLSALVAPMALAPAG
ncbi:AzlD domain-containing protein, partial [Vibrio parahaemolyticus]